MYFYVKNATSDQMQAASADFIISGTTKDGTFGGTNLFETDGTNSWYAFYGEVTSIQMADPITAIIEVADKKVTFKGYTVKKYLDTLLEQENAKQNKNEKLIALVNALKDYGYDVQKTLHDTNSVYLANGPHVSMDKARTSDNYEENGNDLTTATNAAAGYGINKNHGVTGLTFTLNLDGRTDLIVYLPEGATIPDNPTITRTGSWDKTDGDGNASTWNNNTTSENLTTIKDYIYNSTNKTVTFPDISAHELFYKYTIPVTFNSDSDSKSVVVSPMSYVKSALALAARVKAQKTLDSSLTDDYKVLGYDTTPTDLTEAQARATRFQNALVSIYNYYKAICSYKGLTPLTTDTSTSGEGTDSGSGE